MELKEANDIIRDARQACMIVEDSGIEIVTIRRTPRGVAVILWPDGTATLDGARPDHANNIRSATTVRQILGLAVKDQDTDLDAENLNRWRSVMERICAERARREVRS